MTTTQFWVMAIEAILVTVPSVLLIPRARQSPLFDRVLWIATWLLAFLGAWGAPSYFSANPSFNTLIFADVVIIPTMIGALVGALSINVLLWLMDRFSGPATEEVIEELPALAEETDGGENPSSLEQ
ncbi:MAG: hypothetical protein HZB51_15910 [Chloroflexi bacterium]|nr:hypothetical protein [Chloroflexota bacterium]